MTGSGIISALHGAAAFSHVTNPNGGKTMLDKNIPGKGCNDMCCIDVNKIFDSARDKDCLENLRVFLSADAQEALDRASSIRCRNVDIVSTSISLETVPFNKGYYQVNVRFYFCCTFDVCIYNGTVQEIRGVAAWRQADTAFRRRKEHQHLYFGPEQQFVLSSGSDGLRGTVYSAHCGGRGGCPHLSGYQSGGLQPSFRILLLRCGCVARFHPLLQRHSGRRRLRNEPALCDDRHIYRHQACTSVQIMLPSCNYCLPDKDSTPAGCANDPCSVFASLGFPTGEFIPSTEPQEQENPPHQHGCGGR